MDVFEHGDTGEKTCSHSRILSFSSLLHRRGKSTPPYLTKRKKHRFLFSKNLQLVESFILSLFFSCFVLRYTKEGEKKRTSSVFDETVEILISYPSTRPINNQQALRNFKPLRPSPFVDRCNFDADIYQPISFGFGQYHRSNPREIYHQIDIKAEKKTTNVRV